MTRKSLYVTAPLALVLCVAGATLFATRDKLYRYHYESFIGTSLDLKIAAPTRVEAEQAEAAALAELLWLSSILSSYDPNSKFSRWQRRSDQPTRVSTELYEILNLFDHWREDTGGALDAPAEAISKVLRSAAAENRLPTENELASAAWSVRRLHWRLDAGARTATHTNYTPLVLNSFVRSYIAGRAADAALAYSQASGIAVNLGGDLVVRGSLREIVDVADPLRVADSSPGLTRLRIRDRAVATSGNYRRV